MRATKRFSLRIEPIDLDATLGCGQAFRWTRGHDGSWEGVIGRDVFQLKKSDDGVIVGSLLGGPRSREAASRYLRASDDVVAIQRSLSDDEVLSRGMDRVRGLRLVRMDEWECLISYALATYANIPRIRSMIDSISHEFGERIAGETYAFPSIARLRVASERDLARCGLGYRAGYVRRICESVDTDELRRMKRMRYPDLRDRLKDLPGVGDKVADCVSLFGFGKLEAFPVDVWIRRALWRLYGVKGSYSRLSEFAIESFGEFAGYAQEYLFFNERTLASADGCVFSE